MKLKTISVGISFLILGMTLNSSALGTTGVVNDRLHCAEKLKAFGADAGESTTSMNDKDSARILDQGISRQIESLPGIYQKQAQYSRSKKLPMPFKSGYIMALMRCGQIKDADFKEKIAKAKAAIEIQ